MTVRGKTIYHCSGVNKGKKLKTYVSKGKAKRAHRAIMANKGRRGK